MLCTCTPTAHSECSFAECVLEACQLLLWGDNTTGHLRKTRRFRFFFRNGGLFCSCLCVLSFPIRRRCSVVCSPMRCQSPWRCYRVAAVVVVEMRFFLFRHHLCCFLLRRPLLASRTSILFRKMTCNMPPHVVRIAAPPSNVVSSDDTINFDVSCTCPRVQRSRVFGRLSVYFYLGCFFFLGRCVICFAGLYYFFGFVLSQLSLWRQLPVVYW